MNKSLGFIGIGLMGQPMTLRLLAAGYTVNIWNRSTEKLGGLLSLQEPFTVQASLI